MSGVAVQFATQFGANATQKYVGVAVFRMENDSLAHASILNRYTIFLKQIIPCDVFMLGVSFCGFMVVNVFVVWVELPHMIYSCLVCLSVASAMAVVVFVV